MKGRLAAIGLLACVVVACNSSKVAGTAKPTPSPSSGVTDAQWAAAWAGWGISPPPPRNVASFLPRPLPRVANRTNGQVNDGTARTWVEAWVRDGSIESWLVAHLRDQTFGRPDNPLGNPNAALGLYSGVETLISRARREGANRVVGKKDSVIVSAEVVAVSPNLNQQVKQPHVLTPFALSIRVQGPSDAALSFPDGHEEDLAGLRPAETSADVISGEYRDDPVLGPLWYVEDDFDCSTEVVVRPICPA